MSRVFASSISTGLSVLLCVGSVVSQEPNDRANTPARDKAGTAGNLEVLSNTQGVDFGPYLSEMLKTVRTNWYNLIPVEARPPQLMPGLTSIEFAILPDGKVAGVRIVHAAGSVALDRAAWGGVMNGNPYPPLPKQFTGPYLALRFHFYYNPDKLPADQRPAAKPSQQETLKPSPN